MNHFGKQQGSKPVPLRSRTSEVGATAFIERSAASFRAQDPSSHGDRIGAIERQNERCFGQVSRNAFERIRTAHGELHSGQKREVIQRAERAAAARQTERNF